MTAQTGSKITKQTSVMSKKGLNLAESPQLLDTKWALTIQNYMVLKEGGIEKRKGLEKIYDGAATYSVRMLEKFTDNSYFFAYNDKLALYDKTAGTAAVIHTFAAASNVYSGQRYAGYFFLTNGIVNPIRVYQQIKYDTKVSNFTAGEKLTGGTSAATATILENKTVYTPAYLTGGGAATAVLATWTAVTDGSFRATIDGTVRNMVNITFVGCATLAAVAERIQTAIREQTGSLETCIWDTDHFVVRSVNTTVSSAITVTSATGSGTDISGVAATAFMDAEAGRGTATAGAVNYTALVLQDITGTFQNNELIKDTKTGEALADGTVAWQVDTIPTAPVCNILKIVGARLFCGGLRSDPTAVKYSALDTGGNPPYTNWTVGSLSTDPGQLQYRRAGTVKSIESFGDSVVVFAENGKWAFNITIFDSAGAISKVDKTIIQRIDFGGSSGAITTPEGLFYVNEGGLWQLIGLGQPELPYSEQEMQNSINLGSSYFDGVNLDNADIIYSQRYNTIFITCAKGSSINNLVIAYNLDLKAFFEILGWNVNCFLNDNEDLFAGSAITTKLFQLFTGYTDDGVDIATEYEQEISLGELETRKELRELYVHGFLSPSTEIGIQLNVYDAKGIRHEAKRNYKWEASSTAASYAGYGMASWGDSSWGGNLDLPALTEDFNGAKILIRNIQRLRIKITEQSKTAHAITFLTAMMREKVYIRRRQLIRT